jgi:hypothetical protein
MAAKGERYLMSKDVISRTVSESDTPGINFEEMKEELCACNDSVFP